MNLNEEIRCGFLVDKKRKAIWKTQLDMLELLLDVCDKHNIKIFAVAGTLLGAIRHKGFIPWDDDIDMGMLREDFNKLLEVGPSEFKEPYFFQTATTDDDYYSPLIRLRDSRTTAIINHESHNDFLHKCNNGIYIDIFPFDGLTDNLKKRRKQFFKVRLLNMVLRERIYVEKKAFLGRIRHFIFSKTINKKKRDRLFTKYNKICSMYSYDGDMVALIQGSVYNKAYYWHLSDLVNVSYVPFENIMIPIPIGYKRCLEIQYGDYMEMPPIEKRGAHHAIAVVFDPFVDYKTYIMLMGEKNNVNQ